MILMYNNMDKKTKHNISASKHYYTKVANKENLQKRFLAFAQILEVLIKNNEFIEENKPVLQKIQNELNQINVS